MTLLAVPNLSEGRDFAVLERLQQSIGSGVDLLDQHDDIDHNRAVFTIAGEAPAVETALLSLAAAAIREIDMVSWSGVHPAIGSMDVCPLVWIDDAGREQAEEAARRLGEQFGELGVPVFFYGGLARDEGRRERAFFRDGGLDRLWQRLASGELEPDFGPQHPHPAAGGWLVTARPPLAAFNIELETADLDIASEIAAQIRETGGGLSGVRAIGLTLSTGRTQVSTNVHDPAAMPLARVVEAVRDGAQSRGTHAVDAELVGLLPELALVDYPADLPIRDFDPDFHIIERRIKP